MMFWLDFGMAWLAAIVYLVACHKAIAD